ncbi:hypothetical protein [Variovorax gossypii]
MKFKLLMAASALLPLAAFADAPGASVQADPPAVRAFYKDPEHCAYMAGLPENEAPEFIARFEADVLGAVNALRARNASMDLTAALFHLKAGCDRVLAEAG